MKKPKASQKKVIKKRGRKSKYDTPEFLSALHKVRRVMEFRNAEVMKENMAEWPPFIEKDLRLIASPNCLQIRLVGKGKNFLAKNFAKVNITAGGRLMEPVASGVSHPSGVDLRSKSGVITLKRAREASDRRTFVTSPVKFHF